LIEPLSKCSNEQISFMRLEELHIHILGIGGAGMSAIARLLRGRGIRVSGCDGGSPTRGGLAVLDALRAEGIPTWAEHSPTHWDGVDVVAPSSAIKPDEPELAEARRRGLPIWHRGDLLNVLMQNKADGTPAVGVAVAGTHGKSTTTSMIATVLMDAGVDPSFIIGATPLNLGTNARAGNGDIFVVEADEYDRTFLRFFPKLGVVTNIEFDHPDIYKDLDDTLDAFAQFASHVPADGGLVLCADDAGCEELLRRMNRTADDAPQTAGRRPMRAVSVVTYGIHRGEWRALHVRGNPLGGMDFKFTGSGANGELSGDVSLRVPGEHNVRNALAALIVADACGVPVAQAAESLGAYRGADRRFEWLGEARGVRVFDDYAHHPTEIKATLLGARMRYPVGNIWAVWQPHTFSRTIALLDEFSTAFGDADHVIVLPIYAAREKHEDFGFAASALNPIEIARKLRHKDARNAASFGDALGALLAQVRGGDVVITLSAGDGNEVGKRLLEMLK
jgi:UDP-N-acetylmuramate--alanine ligase